MIARNKHDEGKPITCRRSEIRYTVVILEEPCKEDSRALLLGVPGYGGCWPRNRRPTAPGYPEEYVGLAHSSDWFKDLENFPLKPLKRVLHMERVKLLRFKNLVSDAALHYSSKIWSLERENRGTESKLEIYNDISSIRITPVLEELKENNIKDLLRAEEELVCGTSIQPLKNLTWVTGGGQASSSKSMPRSPSSLRHWQNSFYLLEPTSSQDPEGVLLIKAYK
ncbi:hypothetical protein AVEN_268192-1 [Araneus ventricosus]|uniref:Uncharacterized protein n=1 Tax=Araneus ventricosus TaxID=182803 RepID=A0A4Y2NWI8_ARAVE|nr:hypothetical protein AVEN_268192-1 [Araneus ventricosus]